MPLSVLGSFPPTLFRQALPPAHGTALRGHAVLFKLDKQKKDGPGVAYRLLGSGFIGSTSWTLAAIGAVLFSLGILAALMSSPPID